MLFIITKIVLFVEKKKKKEKKHFVDHQDLIILMRFGTIM